ncbi:MAG: hypothetical protein ACI9W1_001641 [Candidatus Azotimanducaceae bacterium]|jgi:hypothetical protein
MAKRRIVLTSQEMNDLSGKIKLLESQLSRSNNRVSELESDVRKIQKLVEKKSKRKNPDLLCDEVIQLTSRAINPPVTVREERLALELAQELALAEGQGEVKGEEQGEADLAKAG